MSVVTVKRYLATMGHNTTRAVNRGLVDLTDDGYILDADGTLTPVEDFGMYQLRDAPPFPPTDSDELFDSFMALLKAQEDSYEESVKE